MLDKIVERVDMKETLGKMLRFFTAKSPAMGGSEEQEPVEDEAPVRRTSVS